MRVRLGFGPGRYSQKVKAAAKAQRMGYKIKSYASNSNERGNPERKTAREEQE